MQRRYFSNGDIMLSYLDAGGTGVPVIALHAYWMEAGTWTELAQALQPAWRVIALDQRGHGESDKPLDLSWNAFIGDLEALLDHLGFAGPVMLMGNSLGGTVAFRFAARRPERVRAMVIEEAPVVEDADLGFMRAWEGVFPTHAALKAAIGERLAWSVEPSFRKVDGGWTLAFSASHLADAQRELNGTFWADWLATQHPVLLVRGTESRAVDGDVLRDMAVRRPGTQLEVLEAGHVAHHDAAKAFGTSVRSFLETAAV